MPSLEEALRKQTEAEVAAIELAGATRDREKLAGEHAEFARLERLIGNADVAWLHGQQGETEVRHRQGFARTFGNAPYADEKPSLPRKSLTFAGTVHNARDLQIYNQPKTSWAIPSTDKQFYSSDFGAPSIAIRL